MHIAHRTGADSLSVEQLATMTGLKRRQLANLARRGDIPGATRPDGLHFHYPLTSALRDWIRRTRRRVQESRLPILKRSKQNVGIIIIHGVRQDFDTWLLRVGGLAGILGMKREEIREILGEMDAIAHLHASIESAL